MSLDYAEYTQGLDKTDQAALKFAQNMERKVTAAVKTATVALTALTAAGAGVLAAGIKNAIDAQDEFAKLSKQTGLAVDTLAGLKFAADQSGTSIERVSKATRNFSTLVADAANGSSEAASKIKSLGLNVDELLKLNPEQRFLKMAGALEKFGAEDQAVALTRVLGDRMAELVPLLSGGEDGLRAMMEEGKRLNPVTAESAAQAEKFNDSLDSLQREATQFVQVITVNLLPALSNIISDMREAARTGSALDVVMAGLGSTFREVFGKKATSDIAGVRVEIFKVEERIRELQAKRNSSLGFLVSQQEIELEKVKLGELNKQLGQLIKAKQELQKQPASTNAPKASLLFDEPKAQLEARIKQTKRLVSEEERLAKALQEEGKRLTEQIDPLVKRNNEIERYKTLLESGAISEGIYSQAVERSTEDYLKALGFVAKETEVIEENTKQLGNTARDVFDSMEQIAIQGVRNIQSSFADGIFNFFDRGLKGMVDSVVTAVGRMASEFASIKLLQAAGGLFGMGGAGTAFASGGSIAAGGAGGSSALSLASLGSSAASLFSTGFGTTSLMSGLGSALPGAAGSFFTGMGVSGGGAAASAAGFSGAASMGASFAAAAGPAIALYATTAILKSFAGDKRMGGGFGKGLNAIGDIPIIGDFIPVVPLMNTLFGRGPYKFREQQILGNVSASGFDGEIADVFKSKGGLFLGNKHRRQGAENESEIVALFDSAIQGFAQSTRAFADTLGLDASSIDDYSKKIFIRSQKGQQLSEEIINEMLTGIGDDFARRLIPEIDSLTMIGETASQAMSRLGGEFSALSSVLEVMGVNAQDALGALKAMSFEQRNSLVTMAGGIEALSQKTAFFFDNILTDADRLEILSNRLTEALGEFGVTGTITVEQLRDAVQSGALSAEQLNAAFNLAPLILQVDQLSQSVDQLSQSTNVAAESVRDLSQVQSAFTALDKSVQAERNRLTDEYNARLAVQNERIQDINASISKLSSLAGALKTAADQLRPLGLTGARNQLTAAIEQARAGNFPDAASLQQALQTLGSQSGESFGSRADFIRSQAASASMVDELGGLVDNQLLLEERSLAALEAARDRLRDGFDNEMARLNSIIDNARLQVDLLSGIDTTLLSIQAALGGFNAAVSAVSPASGSAVSDSDIRDYFNVARTPQEIAADAARYGLSSGRIAAAAGFTPQQVEQFFRDNPDIPRFATGTSFVPSTGPAIVHRGERIINPEQNQDLIDLLRDLVVHVQEGTIESAELRRLLRNSMQETDNGMAMTTVAA